MVAISYTKASKKCYFPGIKNVLFNAVKMSLFQKKRSMFWAVLASRQLKSPFCLFKTPFLKLVI